jgi:hypothetical protein
MTIARRLAAGIVLAFAVMAANDSAAQPVDRETLDHVEITHGEHAIAITIYFRFPTAYVRHFPYESGDTLLIRVQPAFFARPEMDTPQREALRPPDDAEVPLSEIVFDRKTLWDPYLILHFRERVDFQVRPGRDPRSIVVEIPRSEAERRTPLPSSSPSS